MNVSKLRRALRLPFYRVHQIGRFHYWYFESSRKAASFAITRSRTDGGDWKVLKVSANGNVTDMVEINQNGAFGR
jgi:hypothetical protein